MGLPEGHVTDVPGLTRNEQLKALGNGVVPQQAYAALQMMAAGVAPGEVARDGLLPTPRARDAQDEGYEAGLRRMKAYSTSSLGTRVKGL